MLAELERGFARLELLKHDLGARFAGRSAIEVGYRARPGTWSMADVAEHLMKVERAFSESGRKRLGESMRPVRARESAAALAVRIVMRSPIRVKTPEAAKAVMPEKSFDSAGLWGEWDQARRNIRALLDKVTAEQRQLGLFQHPVSGALTAGQGVQFLEAHFRHHHFQIARIERALRAR